MISVELLAHIKRWEGFRAEPYDDNGHLSIGYGTRAKGSGDCVTREEAEWRAVIHLGRCASGLIYLFPVKVREHLAPARRDALLAMIYQLGPEGVHRFPKMRMAIEVGSWALAAHHALDSRWAREQTPERATEVATMIATGEYVGG